jgi:hypothetical protein
LKPFAGALQSWTSLRVCASGLMGRSMKAKPLGTYLELVEDKMMCRLLSEDGLLDRTKR